MTSDHSTPDNVVPLDLYRARRKADDPLRQRITTPSSLVAQMDDLQPLAHAGRPDETVTPIFNPTRMLAAECRAEAALLRGSRSGQAQSQADPTQGSEADGVVIPLPVDPITAAQLVLRGVADACRGRREAAGARETGRGVVVALPLDPLDALRARFQRLADESRQLEARLEAAFPRAPGDPS